MAACAYAVRDAWWPACTLRHAGQYRAAAKDDAENYLAQPARDDASAAVASVTDELEAITTGLARGDDCATVASCCVSASVAL